MSIKVFYNEINPFCCAWLSNLMDAGHIRQGVICDKSIADLTPDDVRPYDLAHFFAGIAGWDYALTLAGWRFDGRVTWTGSCPCQPFSAAGKQRGSDDERHLWPAWFRLVRECRPCAVMGEQVGGSAGLAWLDHVLGDLESAGYAAAAAVVPAGAVGAPHRRERLWFVADADGRDAGAEGLQRGGQHGQQPQDGGAGRLADVEDIGRGQGRDGVEGDGHSSRKSGGSCALGLDDAEREGLEGFSRHGDGTPGRPNANRPIAAASAPSAWDNLEWIPCADGKSRPTQPGIFPLAPRLLRGLGKVRTGILRGAGNSIVPQCAAEVIRAYMECRP